MRVSIAHGAELAQHGMPALGTVMGVLSRLAALDAKVAVALNAEDTEAEPRGVKVVAFDTGSALSLADRPDQTEVA